MEKNKTDLEQLEQLVARLASDSLPASELLRLVDHEAAIMRVNTLLAMSRAARSAPGLVDAIVAAALDERNNVRLMGTVTVAHEAIACLFRVGTEEVRRQGEQLLQQLPALERSNLEWYLRSEGLRDESGPGMPKTGGPIR